VLHHGVVNSEILDLAFIAFWNQTLFFNLSTHFSTVLCSTLPLTFSAATLYGPLHSKAAINSYLTVLEDAKKQGGNIVCGGKVSVLFHLLME
jgi:hypothetical protein